MARLSTAKIIFSVALYWMSHIISSTASAPHTFQDWHAPSELMRFVFAKTFTRQAGPSSILSANPTSLHFQLWQVTDTNVSHQAHSGYIRPWRFKYDLLIFLRDFKLSETSRRILISLPSLPYGFLRLLSRLPGLRNFRLRGLAIPRLFETDVRMWSFFLDAVIQPFFHGVSLFRTYYISLNDSPRFFRQAQPPFNNFFLTFKILLPPR